MPAAKKKPTLATPAKAVETPAQKRATALKALKSARRTRIKEARALARELERIRERLTIVLNAAESLTQPDADPPLPSFIAGPGKKGLDNDP